MATGRTASQRGITVDNLDEALRGMSKLRPAVAKEAKDMLRDESKRIRKAAWGQAPGGAPAKYAISSMTKAMGYSVTNKGAAIRLLTGKGLDREGRKVHTSYVNVMEFGESKSFIPVNRGRGKPGGLRAYRGRVGGAAQAKPHKPPTSSDLMSNRGGYMLLPTFRQELPKAEKRIVQGFVKLYNKTMRQAGVRAYR